MLGKYGMGILTGTNDGNHACPQERPPARACDRLDRHVRFGDRVPPDADAGIQRLESVDQRKLATLDELKKSLTHRAFSSQM